MGHCQWQTHRSPPGGKEGHSWQPLASGMALLLLSVAPPASRTPARTESCSQGEWLGWGSSQLLGWPGLAMLTGHSPQRWLGPTHRAATTGHTQLLWGLQGPARLHTLQLGKPCPLPFVPVTRSAESWPPELRIGNGFCFLESTSHCPAALYCQLSREEEVASREGTAKGKCSVPRRGYTKTPLFLIYQMGFRGAPAAHKEPKGKQGMSGGCSHKAAR